VRGIADRRTPKEIGKTLAALEVIPMCLNWSEIFSLPDQMHRHMTLALKHLEFFADKVHWAILRENGVRPVSKMTKAPFPGIITSSKGLLQEGSSLPMVHTRDGFDLNAYKLMKKLEYDFSKPSSLGRVIDAKPYGPNDAQKMV